MAYSIQVRPAFERSFAKLTKNNRPLQRRIASAVDGLKENPRPPGSRKLENERDADEAVWRIRVGDFRVLYVIRDRQLVVLLLRVADRKEAYR